MGANRFELLTDIGGERFAESQSTRCDTARILFHGTHVGAYEAEPVCEEGVFDDVHAAARALRFFTERHSLSDKAEVIECLQVQVNIAVLDSGMPTCLTFFEREMGSGASPGVSAKPGWSVWLVVWKTGSAWRRSGRSPSGSGTST